MKLLGELRNVVYELVLIVNPTVSVRERKRWKFRPDYLSRVKLRWREPALLKVSKEIRNEAQSVYYGANRFEVYADTDEIEQACTWIRNRQNLRASDCELNFSLRITRGWWKNIMSWVHLAKLAYEVELGNYPESTERWLWRFHISAYSTSFGMKLQEALMLGVKARRRGLSPRSLEVDFEEWALSTISSLRFGGKPRLGNVFESASKLVEDRRLEREQACGNGTPVDEDGY